MKGQGVHLATKLCLPHCHLGWETICLYNIALYSTYSSHSLFWTRRMISAPQQVCEGVVYHQQSYDFRLSLHSEGSENYTVCWGVDYCSNFSFSSLFRKRSSSSSLPIHTLCHVILQCQEIEHAKYTALPATWSGDLLWPLECGWKRQCVSSQQFRGIIPVTLSPYTHLPLGLEMRRHMEWSQNKRSNTKLSPAGPQTICSPHDNMSSKWVSRAVHHCNLGFVCCCSQS